ncbi:MAG: hypothetical protein AAFR96_04895 [Planctomycetota bacterium]
MRHPVLIHLHIPKNAGTSLSRAIKLRLLGRNPISWLRRSDVLGKYDVPGWERRLEIINASPTAASRVRFFEAHAGFGMHEKLPSPASYFTVLREPVDRALSVYHYTGETGERDAEETLDAFISRDRPIGRVWHIDNAQVRYLAATHGVIDSRPANECDRAMLDLAIERLRTKIDHFIVQDRFDEGLLVLANELGWSPIMYKRSNVTKVRRKADETDPGTIARLREMNALDTELYSVAQELFAEKADAYERDTGTGLAEAVRPYRDRLRAYAERSGPIYGMMASARKRRERARGASERSASKAVSA